MGIGVISIWQLIILVAGGALILALYLAVKRTLPTRSDRSPERRST